MISNPIKGTVYVPVEGTPWSNHKDVYYTYKNGEGSELKMWNFHPYDCGLSTTMEANIIFFASSETAALHRLHCMLNWYVIKNQDNPNETMNVALKTEQWKRDKVKHWIDNWDKVKVVEVPMNQFFKVGWAGNDTLL